MGLAACAGPSTGEERARIHGNIDYPPWVMAGSGAYKVEGAPVFVGVGAINGIETADLARQTAENRARYEIEALLRLIIGGMMGEYLASSDDAEKERNAEEVYARIQRLLPEVIDVRDAWLHPDGSVYVQAHLSLERFKGIATRAELDADVAGYLTDNINQAHSQHIRAPAGSP